MLLLLLQLIALSSSATADEYQVGVGIADCTGPPVDINFMGYAQLHQKGCGIHLRQFARAFVFNDNTKLTVFVAVDSAMMCHPVKRSVLKKLDQVHPGVFSIENVILSGTHTHSTPGGFLQDLLYDIPSLGFVRQTFDALVDGIVKAIDRAYENQVPAKLFSSSGELLEANINRSPTAYLLNPPEERAQYEHDVDKTLVQLRILRAADSRLIGAINWFAVHPTSMNNTNCLVSSDNVGYAALQLERAVNGGAAAAGRGPFVAAFASTNLGDVSPNTRGARCIDTGAACAANSSTCRGQSSKCIAFGPGRDMFESTMIIGRRMCEKAKQLLNDASSVEIHGPIKFIHQFVDMPTHNSTYAFANGTQMNVQGCRPAMGYGFAAGTTDGPGAGIFKQGTTSSNAFWNLVRDLIFPPTADDVQCQHPKPILLNTGGARLPYEWQPRIVALQVALLGNFVIVAVPGEFTTMSGRRLRAVIKQTIESKSGTTSNPIVVIAGLSNVYTSYIATFEEYQMQRYEGASTIFGPHTLHIYENLYERLTDALVTDESLEPGPTPPDFSSKLLSLASDKCKFDLAGYRSFGHCTKQPEERVQWGQQVEAKFVAGNPRNHLMHDQTFLKVEREHEEGNWELVATDANWETKFFWNRTFLIGMSEATVQWTIPPDTPPGTYRLLHFGHFKSFWSGNLVAYQGVSNFFTVEADSVR